MYSMDPDFQAKQACLIHWLSAIFPPKSDKDMYNKRDTN